ncbi:MAG: glycosyltransferase involved in cell wall biosynthesis [Flavobacteriaceae bacterium]|jgi:glycosyltransferase involved in cell wall biosynthesis
MVRNADKYYFPIKESILSILPIVDEFIVALGDNSEDDKTREIIESIGSDKVKIIDRVWLDKDISEGHVFADETTFALSQCSGDWCFYIQADEVVHEQDLDAIIKACEDNLDDERVDGLLFDYYHFFGDYNHHLPYHGWYKNEIRVIRNHRNIYSYKDAQSFRKNNVEKLTVVALDAHIYHYGWVRPPEMMQSKKKEHDAIHHGVEQIEGEYKLKPNEFNYGRLGKLPVFKSSHPKVMEEMLAKISWKHKLNYSKKGDLGRGPMKHERFKYRGLTFLENTLFMGKELFPYSNWLKIKPRKQ